MEFLVLKWVPFFRMISFHLLDWNSSNEFLRMNSRYTVGWKSFLLFSCIFRACHDGEVPGSVGGLGLLQGQRPGDWREQQAAGRNLVAYVCRQLGVLPRRWVSSQARGQSPGAAWGRWTLWLFIKIWWDWLRSFSFVTFSILFSLFTDFCLFCALNIVVNLQRWRNLRGVIFVDYSSERYSLDRLWPPVSENPTITCSVKRGFWRYRF